MDIISRVRKSIEDRNEVIRTLYQDQVIRNAVIGTLVKMGCSEADAKDHFTDSIVNFIKACYKPDFEIRSSLTNYLIGTAKNIWLKGVTKSKREGTTFNYPTAMTEPSIEIHLISSERKQLLHLLLNQLDQTCRKVLTLWAINKKMKDIATRMSYKSEGMARKKKHQCLRRLYALIDSNQQIKSELSEP